MTVARNRPVVPRQRRDIANRNALPRKTSTFESNVQVVTCDALMTRSACAGVSADGGAGRGRGATGAHQYVALLVFFSQNE